MRQGGVKRASRGPAWDQGLCTSPTVVEPRCQLPMPQRKQVRHPRGAWGTPGPFFSRAPTGARSSPARSLARGDACRAPRNGAAPVGFPPKHLTRSLSPTKSMPPAVSQRGAGVAPVGGRPIERRYERPPWNSVVVGVGDATIHCGTRGHRGRRKRLWWGARTPWETKTPLVGRADTVGDAPPRYPSLARGWAAR
jgi:hypothetical protein